MTRDIPFKLLGKTSLLVIGGRTNIWKAFFRLPVPNAEQAEDDIDRLQAMASNTDDEDVMKAISQARCFQGLAYAATFNSLRCS